MHPVFVVKCLSPSSPTTLVPLVPTAPCNVTLSGITQTSMMVAWEEPTMPNGILGPYTVRTRVCMSKSLSCQLHRIRLDIEVELLTQGGMTDLDL